MQAAETEIQCVSLSDSFVSLRRYRIPGLLTILF